MKPNEHQITQLYVGMFDRAADRDGLDFWLAQANAGGTIIDIAYSFAQSDEYQSTYGALTDDQLVDKIYFNLFDRTPDADGKAYWLNEMANGKPHARLLVDIMSGAQGNDRLILENTAIVAQDWTKTGVFSMDGARNAISSIGVTQGDGVTVAFASDVFLPDQAGWVADMAAAWAQWGDHGRLDVLLRHNDLSDNSLAQAHAQNELLTGEYFRGLPVTQTNVAIEINTGMDVNGDMPDAVITITTGIARLSLFDRVSVLAHEIGHAIGFRTELYDFDADRSTATTFDRMVDISAFPDAVFTGAEAGAVYGGSVPLRGVFNATHTDQVGGIMDSAIRQGQVSVVGVLDKAMLHDTGVLT